MKYAATANLSLNYEFLQTVSPLGQSSATVMSEIIRSLTDGDDDKSAVCGTCFITLFISKRILLSG